MRSATLERVSEAAINIPSPTIPQSTLIELPINIAKQPAIGRLTRYFGSQDAGHQLALGEAVDPFYPRQFKFHQLDTEEEIAGLVSNFRLDPHNFSHHQVIRAGQTVADLSFVKDSLRIAVIKRYQEQTSTIPRPEQIEQKTDEAFFSLWRNKRNFSTPPTDLMLVEYHDPRPEPRFVDYLRSALKTV